MDDIDILFPYEKIRDEQEKLILDIKEAIDNKKNILINAPTGLGKTIAALGPALKNVLENKRTVFFLTSRHTQHLLAIKTIKDIQEKFGVEIKCCDIIGKKWMCSQQGAENMPSGEFSEYCKAMREDDICEFYKNTKTKGKASTIAVKAIEDIKKIMPADTETLNRICKQEKLCPYEIATILAREADVVIADYNYVFNEKIRDNFFLRANKKLEESILIIDEGHNLPGRCREMMSMKLSSYIIDRAIKEAKKFGYEEIKGKLISILDVLNELGSELDMEKEEDYVLKNEFFKKVDATIEYDESMEQFELVGDDIRELQRQSFIGSIAFFMETWKGPDKGFSRTINFRETKYGKLLTLNYKCLDPSIISKDVVNGCVCTIIMSGTLSPTEMYADILGFKNYSVEEYKDPFSGKNKLNLIIPDVTTKYTARNQEQYKKIALILAEVVNAVPGNSFVFFPSYELRNSIYRYFEKLSRKTIFLEIRGMSKEEKKSFLEKFKKYKDSGAVMLGVAQGSFGEGVDMPGELLKCVVVVGVPLHKPNLETKELIEYYDDKYGEGMNYGYIYPAITKTLQNAGRCIRSEKDRGVIVFMDARYMWENYKKCFPADWDMKITKMWKERIGEFFREKVEPTYFH
ncbi:MAG: ATP-dependent DNA helicase [Nanoarchaeota archaeon]|nr:ATP-dependent DNA helicase [Nanoarchaeota archaeon]